MSYYFSIIGTVDNPLFTTTFGTSKTGGDGLAHFQHQADTHYNAFIVNAALDNVEELQWSSKDLYLRKVDSFQNNHVHCLLTGGNVKFMLLMNAEPGVTGYAAMSGPGAVSSRPGTARQNTGAAAAQSLAANPTSPQTEEAVRQFMYEVSLVECVLWVIEREAKLMLQVYEAWVKCLMSPFYQVNQVVTSPIFRSRVATAAKKYL